MAKKTKRQGPKVKIDPHRKARINLIVRDVLATRLGDGDFQQDCMELINDGVESSAQEDKDEGEGLAEFDVAAQAFDQLIGALTTLLTEGLPE